MLPLWSPLPLLACPSPPYPLSVFRKQALCSALTPRVECQSRSGAVVWHLRSHLLTRESNILALIWIPESVTKWGPPSWREVSSRRALQGSLSPTSSRSPSWPPSPGLIFSGLQVWVAPGSGGAPRTEDAGGLALWLVRLPRRMWPECASAAVHTAGNRPDHNRSEAISSKRELTFRSGLVHSFKHVQTGVGASLGFAGKMEGRGSVATFEAPDHQSCFSHWGSLLQAPLLRRGDKPETAQRPYGQAGEPEAMAMLVVSRFFNQRLRADTHTGMESVMSTSLPGGQPG